MLVVAIDDEDIIGLEVAVNDALAVRGSDRAQDLAHDVDRAPRLHRAGAGEDRRERLAIEQLHHGEWPAIRCDADVADIDDVRIADPARSEGFALEPDDRFFVVRVLVEHHLDGDALAELLVLGLVDHTHAAAPDLPEDRVAVFEREADQRLRFCSLHPL